MHHQLISYVFYFSGIDVTPYLKTIPYLGEKLDSSSTVGASTFVIAYAVNKGRYEKICVRTCYRYLCNYLTLFF